MSWPLAPAMAVLAAASSDTASTPGTYPLALCSKLHPTARSVVEYPAANSFRPDLST